MCEPTTLAVAGLAMSAASVGTGYIAKQADYAAKTTAYNQNVVNSKIAAADEQRQILIRTVQEGAKTDQSKQLYYMEGAQKVAKAEVSAAAGGVSGVSVDNLVNDLEGKAALNRTYADENYRMIAQNMQEKLTGTITTQKARVASMPVPQEPSGLAALIGLGEAGVKFGKDFSKGAATTGAE